MVFSCYSSWAVKPSLATPKLQQVVPLSSHSAPVPTLASHLRVPFCPLAAYHMTPIAELSYLTSLTSSSNSILTTKVNCSRPTKISYVSNMPQAQLVSVRKVAYKDARIGRREITVTWPGWTWISSSTYMLLTILYIYGLFQKVDQDNSFCLLTYC